MFPGYGSIEAKVAKASANSLWNLGMYLNLMDLNLFIRSSAHCLHRSSLRSRVFHSLWACQVSKSKSPNTINSCIPNLSSYLDPWCKLHTHSCYFYKRNEVELLQGNVVLWVMLKLPQSMSDLHWLLHQSTIARPDFHVNLLLNWVNIFIWKICI